MMAVLLVAGFGFLLAGLLAIVFGISIKEFSFGNTLIIAGAVGACTGAIMLGLWMVVRELKNIARRLGPGAAAELPAAAPLSVAPRSQAPENGGFLFGRDQPVAQNAGNAEPAAPPSATSPPPWHEESRDRLRVDAPPVPESAEAAPGVKPKRNLLFSSSSRKERERAQARTGEPLTPDLLAPELRPPSPAAPPPESTEAPPASFDDAWPKPERGRGADTPPRRSPRAPSTFTDASAGAAGADRQPPAPRSEDQPPVTVLKSGVVDGMAYSLYSDGSIEAQMPEGMMRFASIDELRAHLDQRP
jgi:hypothetical protein